VVKIREVGDWKGKERHRPASKGPSKVKPHFLRSALRQKKASSSWSKFGFDGPPFTTELILYG
jgi:hypothetical protein